jgi:hypothetical protein
MKVHYKKDSVVMKLDKEISEAFSLGKEINYIALDQLEMTQFCREFGYEFILSDYSTHSYTYKDVKVTYDWGVK